MKVITTKKLKQIKTKQSLQVNQVNPNSKNPTLNFADDEDSFRKSGARAPVW